MTTQSWSSTLLHNSDANFRVWGADFAAKLGAVGMVQTADTGQINWASVTRPATNTAGGYEIWRFNDSLQGTSPIFFKIEYGTAGVATYPQVWITVGTGSNGSGTITGQSSTRVTCAYTGATGSIYDTASAWPSYFCSVTGFLGCAFKAGITTAVGAPPAFFIVRYADTNGTPNGNGFTVYTGRTGANLTTYMRVQSVRTAATAQTFTADTTGMFTLIPHNITGSTTAAGDLQVFAHWSPMNEVRQVFALCGYVAGEIAAGSTFTCTLMGSSRTFIALTQGITSSSVGSSVSAFAMLWE